MPDYWEIRWTYAAPDLPGGIDPRYGTALTIDSTEEGIPA